MEKYFNIEGPLSEEEKLDLEGVITEQELLSCLKTLKNGKSPGSDGYLAEFYKFSGQILKTGSRMPSSES